ncbi:stress-induced hydrophobic peptide [Heterobasidion irregulare TC 32-1]|uniref:Stress-induced hydrophobic peptide n=1 Tax=Heterobasidion irregulare (strain TC 32-1) TaxID=747525 RepID=W4JQX3_HETIT|nr:stress-induced hydrophobic peptide [Heterobasidion irregulare TC 32-1]ETW75864.1 stress-induced hydrophobic peptide [Heterobasidion irregulare TC 32-1]
MSVRGSDVLLILVAIIFPPAAAAFITGCSCDLLINICLTVLGYLPGHIHAFWLIYRKMRAEDTYGHGGYTYVGNGQYEPAYGGLGTGASQQQFGQPQQAPVPSYGATNM